MNWNIYYKFWKGDRKVFSLWFFIECRFFYTHTYHNTHFLVLSFSLFCTFKNKAKKLINSTTTRWNARNLPPAWRWKNYLRGMKYVISIFPSFFSLFPFFPFEMELPQIGKNCQLANCNSLDFLPVACPLCQQTFWYGKLLLEVRSTAFLLQKLYT